jgi:hypothetical protein
MPRDCSVRNCGSTDLSRCLDKPLLKCGNNAEGFGVYLPGHGGPKDGDAVGETVHAHSVFRVRGGLFQPEDGSVVRFFRIYEAVVAGDVLKCLKFFHSNFSVRLFRCSAFPNSRDFLPGHCQSDWHAEGLFGKRAEKPSISKLVGVCGRVGLPQNQDFYW